jgi:hypothetical protein
VVVGDVGDPLELGVLLGDADELDDVGDALGDGLPGVLVPGDVGVTAQADTSKNESCSTSPASAGTPFTLTSWPPAIRASTFALSGPA